jgi:tetratricopeptide (TPR) repeat protein
MTTTRPRDLHDLALTTTPEAAEPYREGLRRVLCVQSGAREAFEKAVATDPNFALGHAALAVLHNDAQDTVQAKASIHQALKNPADDREHSFVNAVDRMFACDTNPLLEHLDEHPRDAFALSMAVPTIAFAGVTSGKDSAALVERLGSAYGDDWWYQGQLAFIRQEQGRWVEAEDLAITALASEPASGHAVHARTHVFYETGEHKAGLAWLDGWIRDQGPLANHRAHFSWHAALHELALGDNNAVRQRYATQLAPPAVRGPRALVDSASLLWRCHLVRAWDGPIPIRPVLDSCPREWLTRPPNAFAAFHAAFALTADGDLTGLKQLGDYAQNEGSPAFGTVVAPLCTGLSEVVNERWSQATPILRAVTPKMPQCGGSAAQQEVVEDTLIHALMCAGRCTEAATVLADRLDRRSSPLDLRLWTAAKSEVGV